MVVSLEHLLAFLIENTLVCVVECAWGTLVFRVNKVPVISVDQRDQQ